MDISEVAKKSGVAASALRYYERKGLIHPLESQGMRRKFSPAVLDQLALIALGQAAGFSLDEIRVMFTPGGEPNIDRAMLAAKADELERMVKHLKAMIQGLRHAVACRAPSHAACPSFQRLLKAAAAGALEGRRRQLGPRRGS
jgi:DNA-binding transcriptional MerR regulator